MNRAPRQGNDERPAGLVLAGGRSRRFGSDKALARLADRPLLAWAAAALAETCAMVAVSAPADSAAAELARSLGLTVLADHPAHAKGPLAGVAAGLDWARRAGFTRLISLPCDAPMVGAGELTRLLAALGPAPAAYAVSPDGPQPLCAVWRGDLDAMLGVRLALGDHGAVRALLEEIGARAVAFDDPAPFRNANTPADLEALAREADDRAAGSAPLRRGPPAG